MNIEIIIVGDELLDGRVLDTHTQTIASHLEALGLYPNHQQTVPDTLSSITTALTLACGRADVCIVTGGLGPTPDDMTLAAAAEASKRALVERDEVWSHITARYAPAVPPETNRKQALVPEGARAVTGQVGTAPSISMKLGQCDLFLLPGVPHEMKWHLQQHALPLISERWAAREPSRPALRTLSFVSVSESALAQSVEALEIPGDIRVTFRAHPMGVDVRLRGPQREAVNHWAEAIIARCPDAFLSDSGEDLVVAVLKRLEHRGLTLGTAESCTGGLVAGALTAIPGSSAVVAGGIVSYSNEVKMARLGVPEAVLVEHGAVSEPCARAMARGAREALGCDVAVSITGIAGPGGGTDEKPVGTVCFGWSGPDFERTQTHRFRGDRDTVRARSVAWSLAGLWREVGR